MRLFQRSIDEIDRILAEEDDRSDGFVEAMTILRSLAVDFQRLAEADEWETLDASMAELMAIRGWEART